MRKTIISMFVIVAVAVAFPVFAKGPMNKATGSITMGSPSQALNFNAHDAGAYSASDKGSVEYSNYEYPYVGAVDYLHYTAPVMCASVDAGAMNTRFMYQIPTGWSGLSGLYVVAQVHDGGTPGINGDTYGHAATGDLATAMSWCETGFAPSMYPVTGGNLVVHTY